MRRFSLQSFYVACLLALAPLGCVAEQALVAVASNFAAPARVIALAFEHESGHSVRLSQGSSGKLYAQIHHGAPFDLFFSADTEKPALLVKEGLAIEGSQRTYARGALALWTINDGAIIDSATLRAGDFSRLAQANPRLAPYGLAAQQVVAGLGLTETLAAKLVIGENISQAYQFVATGNAEFGFVALSQIFTDGGLERGSMWRVPQQLHASIAQDVVLLARGQNNAAAREFMAFLTSAAAVEIIRDFGYTAVGETLDESLPTEKDDG